MDGSGTINPADLNNNISAPLSLGSPDGHLSDGQNLSKRSRSPDALGDASAVANEDYAEESKPRKRGRPAKSKPTGSPSPSVRKQTPSSLPTPQLNSDGVPQESPAQPSPAKAGPANKSVKSLPTQRDHTTDQLAPEGDEYLPRDIDEAGEKKVTPTGHLTDGREYRCRTFLVPNRGNKLFMLATECARTLHYRDSYLLFNKNRSLFKIIANQTEKEDLIHQEILPWSYRSRQIAIVTARSMYRQFGSRMIVDGRRVRDDYWEAKVRKQGFTEDDLASEKRPNTNKPKEGPGTDIGSTGAVAMGALAQSRIYYKDIGPKPLPGISHAQRLQMGLSDTYPFIPTDDMQVRDYGNIQRPRQDITGTPYEDRSQPSSTAEVVSQAAQAEQFNKALKSERLNRKEFFDTFYAKERDPVPAQAPSPALKAEPVPDISQLQSPAHHQQLQQLQQQQLHLQQNHQNQLQQPTPQHQQHQQPSQQQQLQQQQQQPHSQPQQQPQQQQQQHHQQQQGRPQSSAAPPQQQTMMHNQQNPSQMMTPQFARPTHAPNSQQSPVQNMPQGMMQQAMHQRNPSYGYGQGQQNPMYYHQGGMWQQQQQQQQQQGSPLSQQPQQHMSQYNHHPQQQHSPHPQQSPHHAPPQLPQQHSSGSMPAGMMGFQNMGAMPQGYPQLQRGMYPQGAAPQQYMHQTTGGQQPNMMGWTQPNNMGQPQQGWQGY